MTEYESITANSYEEEFKQSFNRNDNTVDTSEINRDEVDRKLMQLSAKAIRTIEYLLAEGSEQTKFRSAVWLLERFKQMTPQVTKGGTGGMIMIGFDDDEDI